jgi:hypothetical protein
MIAQAMIDNRTLSLIIIGVVCFVGLVVWTWWEDQE